MNEERRWEELAAGIVEQAAVDYHNSRFFLDTVDMRSYTDEAQKRSRINVAKRTIHEIENFFKGDWYKTIMPELDGVKAFEALKNTYDTEVRDSKMDIFMKKR